MKKKIWMVVLALVAAFFYTVVGPKIKTQNLSFDGSEIIPFILCFLICGVINVLAVIAVPKLSFGIKNEKLKHAINQLGDTKLLLIVWGVIFVSWLPAYLVCFPGILSYDIINQTRDALGVITNNAHPVLHTFLLRVFMRLGDGVFGSYEAGLGILALIQMILLSYSLARVVLLLKKYKVPMLIVVFTAICSALWFMNACLSISMIKDALYSAFLVLFGCHFTEIVIAPRQYIKKKKNLILLSVIGFLLCATRNNGFHIYVFCFIGLILLRIKNIKKIKVYIPLIAAIVLPVFAYKIYTGPVFAALEIKPGPVTEAFCVPIQQLKRVECYRAEMLSEEQAAKMQYYFNIPVPTGHGYVPFTADYSKVFFSAESYNNNPIAFWKFYLEIGFHFPKDYIVAFLSNTLGLWYPGQDEFTYVEYYNYPVDRFPVPLERQGLANLKVADAYYASLCTDSFWRTTPVLNIFFVNGYIPWILIFIMILAWKNFKQYLKIFPVFLPLIAQFGIMLLAPMASFRYAWPLFLLLPLSFIAVWYSDEQEKLSDEKQEVVTMRDLPKL